MVDTLGIVIRAVALLTFAASACSQAPDAPGDGGKDVTAPVLVYSCTSDSDCCTAVDGCNARAYVVTQAQQAQMQAYVNSSSGTACLACIPPAVQVSCQAGQCAGVKLPTTSDNFALTSPHCGAIPVDAGTSALDGASAVTAVPSSAASPTGTVFSCGS